VSPDEVAVRIPAGMHDDDEAIDQHERFLADAVASGQVWGLVTGDDG
jgi:hypothetical protein